MSNLVLSKSVARHWCRSESSFDFRLTAGAMMYSTHSVITKYCFCFSHIFSALMFISLRLFIYFIIILLLLFFFHFYSHSILPMYYVIFCMRLALIFHLLFLHATPFVFHWLCLCTLCSLCVTVFPSDYDCTAAIMLLFLIRSWLLFCLLVCSGPHFDNRWGFFLLRKNQLIPNLFRRLLSNNTAW